MNERVKHILGACYDWRVLIGLIALGVGIFIVAPGTIAAALPLLLLAACPLSMLLMMRAMGSPQPSSSMPQQPLPTDRVSALRQELADLSQRQEELAGELRTLEAGQREADGAEAAGRSAVR